VRVLNNQLADPKAIELGDRRDRQQPGLRVGAERRRTARRRALL